MGGENELDVRIEFAYHADEFLLPFDVQGGFGFVHEENAVGTVAHEDGQQDDKHLLLTGREFVGQEAFAILQEDDFVAAAVDGLAGVAEELVHHVLELAFRGGEVGGLRTLVVVTGEEFDHAVADVDLIVEVTALQEVELPVEFGLDVGICHAGGKVTHDERAVVAADNVVGDIGGIGMVEGDADSFAFAALYLAGKFFEVMDGAVEDGTLADAVDAGEDVDVGAEIPGDVVAVPEAVYLDSLDVVGLLFHGLLFLIWNKYKGLSLISAWQGGEKVRMRVE